MSAWPSFVISCFALVVSGVTAWLTFFRKGRLVMTQPTSIFLGPDGPMFDRGKNKVYLRTLLYSTAKRGHVLESLHLAVHRNETKQNFNIWVYGKKGDLERGSGLFVPQEGLTLDHYFLLPADGADFAFLEGTYVLTVFAKVVGQPKSTELLSIRLSISEAHAKSLNQPGTGIFFDWGPDQQSYHPYVQHRQQVDSEQARLSQLFAEKGVSLTARAQHSSPHT